MDTIALPCIGLQTKLANQLLGFSFDSFYPCTRSQQPKHRGVTFPPPLPFSRRADILMMLPRRSLRQCKSGWLWTIRRCSFGQKDESPACLQSARHCENGKAHPD
jgi:hypothetical protein